MWLNEANNILCEKGELVFSAVLFSSSWADSVGQIIQYATVSSCKYKVLYILDNPSPTKHSLYFFAHLWRSPMIQNESISIAVVNH